MGKIKKFLTGVTLVCIFIPVIILITGIFGANIFTGLIFKIMLSLATIAIASAFSISALNIYNKRRIISIINIALLAASTLFAFIIYWSDFATPELYNQLVIILGMATVLFSIITGLYIKLGKRHIYLQITTYICVIIIDILLTIEIFNVTFLATNGLWQAFAVLCLVTFALLCTTSVLGRKSNIEDDTDDKYIKILKSEYEQMKARIAELEANADKNTNNE